MNQSTVKADKASLAKLYDALAAEYDEAFQSGFRERIQNDIIFTTLEPFLRESKCRILDAGGGTGFSSIPLAAKGHEVIILDMSKKMLKVAQSKAKKLRVAERVKIQHGDMEDIKQPNESFDVVLCHLSLCYVKNPGRALSEFSRVLRKGGLLSLVAENKGFFSIAEAFKGSLQEAHKRLKMKTLFVTMSKLGRFRTFERQELLAMLNEAGFEPVRTLGLRILGDYLLMARKTPPNDLETLKKLEHVLSQSQDWNSTGRFHFLICRKK
jgi:S-adenosylmethionine-dependent methyltransferase